MRHYTFVEKSEYKIAILVNEIRKDEIEREYLIPFGIKLEDVLILTLHQTPNKKKTPMAEMRQYILEELTPIFTDFKIEYLMICDADYYKAFTKASQSDRMLGYVVDTTFGPWKCTYVPNYRATFYDPIKIKDKIKISLNNLKAHMDDLYEEPGTSIIKNAYYLYTVDEISQWLDRLLTWDRPLSTDIEGFSLKHYSAGIGTITLCWSKEEGIAFPVDYNESPDPDYSKRVRHLLKKFFIKFKNKMIWHNISYDVTVLIYQLFMKDILDTEGLLQGMDILLQNWDDTKLIAYLATNSCAGNKLSLKDQAQEYAGNYAVEEIEDIRKIPLPELLQYNLVDGLSTWFVHEKHWDRMVSDNQLEIYETIFKPAILDIIQMQLTGMPVNMPEVLKAEKVLQADCDVAINSMKNLKIIEQFEYYRLESFTNQKNSEWVKKRMTIAEMAQAAQTNEAIRKEVTFNPNSGPQLIKLLYEQLGLPVLDRTDTKLPATGAETLEKLINHTQNDEVIKLLKALIAFNEVNIILTTFIPALKQAVQGPDGWWYLFGNFNLGGTVSGRLSSSKPNLQNLPATGTKYAKIIKLCFSAPRGWLFVGVDFSSLEDRISALTTKDPNKLKVYTDGYDGHSLRAYAYFGDQMPDIDPNSVESINSIAKKYKSLRQDSKIPTFSLTYMGTYKTIMDSQGWSEEKAKKVESSYHALYAASDEWVQKQLDQASIDGYITAAFGLRVRTPLLAQVIRGNSKTPFQAEAEGRTAGNALGQSWCLLNSRAGSEFMGKVRNSKYRLDIRPCAQIHDASYYLIRDNVEVVMYTNKHLIDAVSWQNHPAIWHPEVKLGGELSIFYPTWADECQIANDATEAEIFAAVEKHLEKLSESASKAA